MEIKILEMTLQDFNSIKNILNSEFDEFWSEKILKEELESKNKKYFVAKENGEIVGFAGYMVNPPDFEIMNIVTKKNKRGKGIGTALLNKIIEIAKNNHAEKIFLEVNEKNIIARKLYEKTGFEEIGRRKNYYNFVDDAIIMSKKQNIL